MDERDGEQEQRQQHRFGAVLAQSGALEAQHPNDGGLHDPAVLAQGVTASIPHRAILTLMPRRYKLLRHLEKAKALARVQLPGPATGSSWAPSPGTHAGTSSRWLGRDQRGSQLPQTLIDHPRLRPRRHAGTANYPGNDRQRQSRL